MKKEILVYVIKKNIEKEAFLIHAMLIKSLIS